MNQLLDSEIVGFIKPLVDIHTLGISGMMNLLRDCGYRTIMASDEIQRAVLDVSKINNFSLFKSWVVQHRITRLSFSYRLDPQEGCDYFCKLFYLLKGENFFLEDGGNIRGISFAGLPDTCELIKHELGASVLLFQGNESPLESLRMQGVPDNKLPESLLKINTYDEMRMEFAKKVISDEKFKKIKYQDHYGYPECGTSKDTLSKRLAYCKIHHSLPIIRAHVGPYNPNRSEAISEFISWTKQLAATKFLDVLSIGSSQLTQSNFGEDWGGLANGGGVPINSEQEYRQIREAAFPMLVRTYAGTKNVSFLAEMHERSLNIAWHALSFWWFCEIDGRGKNTVLENLKEHIEAIKFIAKTGKPVEPNVPHHFAFRGADDITYIISAYLACKTAKKNGVKHVILQNMLNTPKHTWGVQDLAKGRVMYRLVKSLEDQSFKVTLQTRAGLDYFMPDLEMAKVQLADVTALMDDIEPENQNSPEIIHVVSYSEAVRLANPEVVTESIRITLASLNEYRQLRKLGKIENMAYSQDVEDRFNRMFQEAKEAIDFLENNIPNLYTPDGLNKIFRDGLFPVPFLFNARDKYPQAVQFQTAFRNGGVQVVDEQGEPVVTLARYKRLIS